MNPLALTAIALRHPDEEMIAGRRDVLAEARALPPGPGGDALRAFLAWWAAVDPDELRRAYVETFDFSRRTSLDLTWYTHGDLRQRGLALLALRRRYDAAGLELQGSELPDHLPVVLEYAALEPEDGGALLRESRAVLEIMRLGLERAESPFAGLLTALCAMLPRLTDEDRAEVRRLAREGPPGESVGLEPFAPPEVMPDPVRPARSPCAAPATGTPR